MPTREKFSYSKLNTYNSCPFKYKLQYVDKNYAFTPSAANEFGTSMHEAEEAIGKCIQANVPIDYVSIKNDFIKKQFELIAKYPKDYFEADKTGRSFYEKAFDYLNNKIFRLENFMRSNPTYEIVGLELKVQYQFSDTRYFEGFIDRLIRDKATDKYYIYDIKSWAEPEDDGELATPLQFVIYSFAVQEMFNVDAADISCIYDLPVCDTYQSGGTSGYLARGLKKIEKLFNGIDCAEFKPKPSPLCNWCGYCRTNPDTNADTKYLCPYYSLWERDSRNKYDIGKHENEWQGLNNHDVILEAFHKKYNITIKQKETDK